MVKIYDMNDKAIVFIVDGNYANYARLAIKDVWEASGGRVPVYLLTTNGITHQVIKDLTSTQVDYGIDMKMICVKNDEQFYAKRDGIAHITKTAYAKMLMADLLPKHVKFAYYFDIDILVMRDLSEIFEIEPEKSLCAVDHRSDDDYVRLHGRGGKYFNAGVLIANLDRWRSLGVVEKAAEVLNDDRWKIRWLEQDVMSIVFDDDWEELPLEYNFLMSRTFNPYIENCGDLDWDKTKVDPAILHFLGPSKPWGNSNDKHTHRIWRARFSQI
jgi:lipopolysaccharide biosynthesis glycosyltransferase